MPASPATSATWNDALDDFLADVDSLCDFLSGPCMRLPPVHASNLTREMAQDEARAPL